jgi:hypothetical protein
MKPKLLSWNVRGLNEVDKWLKVRNHLRQWKADIICLQETKLEFISINIERNCGVFFMLAGATFLLVGCQVVFYYGGTRGLWRRLRCVWGSMLWPAPLEML